MDEAEQLCDRLIVMDHGRIVAEGTPGRADPRVLHPRGARGALRLRPQRRAGRPSSRGFADRIEALPDRVLLYTEDGEAALEAVAPRGLEPVTSLVRRSSLEDVFLRLTGRSLVD